MAADSTSTSFNMGVCPVSIPAAIPASRQGIANDLGAVAKRCSEALDGRRFLRSNLPIAPAHLRIDASERTDAHYTIFHGIVS